LRCGFTLGDTRADDSRCWNCACICERLWKEDVEGDAAPPPRSTLGDVASSAAGPPATESPAPPPPPPSVPPPFTDASCAWNCASNAANSGNADKASSSTAGGGGARRRPLFLASRLGDAEAAAGKLLYAVARFSLPVCPPPYPTNERRVTFASLCHKSISLECGARVALPVPAAPYSPPLASVVALDVARRALGLRITGTAGFL
jgi:hypothetical protein